MRIIIIEPFAIEDLIKKDYRTTAIAAGPSRLYKKEGVWDLIRSKVEPIKEINILDGNSRAMIDFDFREFEKEKDFFDIDSLGYVVKNSLLLKSINKVINKNNKNSKLKIIKASVSSLSLGTNFATVKLDNGKSIMSSLVIAADGKKSSIRKMSGILEKKSNYDQWAFVCQITHSNSHLNKALEKFLPGGPLAILPMKKENKYYKSSVIWSDKKNTSLNRLKSAKNNLSKIAYEIERHTFEWLGKIKTVESSAVYPLELILAKNFVSNRFVLIGEAAHGIHPIAGQGFNLGIRDIDILAKKLLERSSMGLDIGSKRFLKDYEKLRRADVNGLVFITHNLNQFFRITNSSLKLFRRLGVSGVQKSRTLKKAFMKYAMGF